MKIDFNNVQILLIKCLDINDLTKESLKIFDSKIRHEIGYGMSVSNIIMQFTRNRNLNPMWMGLLKTIVAKAKEDEQYASIAGGVLSGMLPTDKVLTFSFLGKTTLKSITLVFSSFYKSFKTIIRNVCFICITLFNSLRQINAYWHWTTGIIKAIILFIRLNEFKRKNK